MWNNIFSVRFWIIVNNKVKVKPFKDKFHKATIEDCKTPQSVVVENNEIIMSKYFDRIFWAFSCKAIHEIIINRFDTISLLDWNFLSADITICTEFGIFVTK